MDVIRMWVDIRRVDIDKVGELEIDPKASDYEQVEVVITHDDYGEVWRPRYGKEETKDAPSGSTTEAKAPHA